MRSSRSPGRAGAVCTLMVGLSLGFLPAPAASAAGPAQPGPPEGAQKDVIPGRYIVVVKEGVDPEKVARDHGVQPENVYRFALKGFGGPVPPDRLDGLKRDPRVASVEPDRVVRADAQTLPTGIDRIDADVNAVSDIDGVDLPRVPVTVAVIDTGIDLDHPDLNVRADLGFSCVKGKKTADDANGHGSHVAGTIAALDNGTGVVGVAPGAAVVPVRVLGSNGSGTLTCLVQGIDYVRQRAGTIAVANMSLSWSGNSSAARSAIQSAVNAGVLFTVAASNEGKDVYGADGALGTSDDTQPAAFPEVATISAAADSDGKPGGLGAGTGYGPDDSFATFSNFSKIVVAGNPVTSPGAAIDLILPGVNIFSTYRDGGYATLSGTSMASPHAAGLAALYIAAKGRATNASQVASIRQALISQGQSQSSGRRLAYPQTEPDAKPEKLGWAGSAVVARNDSATTQEDTSVAVNVLANDSSGTGGDLDVATYDPASAKGGSVACEKETGDCTYTPPSGFTGSDTFTYKATDGTSQSNAATVTITVNPPAGTPVANNVSATTQQNTAVPITLSGSDGETCELTFSKVSQPSHGTLGSIGNRACTPGTPKRDSAQVTYTPAGDYIGSDSFTYRVTDGDGKSDDAVVTISVKGSAFIANFEGDVSGWSATGFWHRTTSSPCTSPDPGYASATHAFYYGQDQSCTYDNRSGNTGTLTSPAIPVVNGSPVAVGFKYWRQVELFTGGSYDQTSAQLSFNGGSTWSTVWSRDSTTSSETDWTAASVNVTASSTSLRVRFVFNTVDALNNDQVGWLIDDVSVT